MCANQLHVSAIVIISLMLLVYTQIKLCFVILQLFFPPYT